MTVFFYGQFLFPRLQVRRMLVLIQVRARVRDVGFFRIWRLGVRLS